MNKIKTILQISLFCACLTCIIFSFNVKSNYAYADSGSDLTKQLSDDVGSQLNNLNFIGLDDIIRNLGKNEQGIFGGTSFLSKVKSLISGNIDGNYNNFYVRRPEYVGVLPEIYRADILNSYAHIRRYCEMPLKLLRAEELSGGEEAFDKILNEIFTRDYNEDYSNVYLSYELFLEYCGLTEEDLRVG